MHREKKKKKKKKSMQTIRIQRSKAQSNGILANLYVLGIQQPEKEPYNKLTTLERKKKSNTTTIE